MCLEEESTSFNQIWNIEFQFAENIFGSVPWGSCLQYVVSDAVPLHCCKIEQKPSHLDDWLLLQEDNSTDIEITSKTFKAETIKTVVECWAERRIEKAEEIVENTE